MNIQKVSISKLNPAPYNPRQDLHPGDPVFEKLKRSMAEFGCVEPIVWNERTGNVVGGHQRLKVLSEAGALEAEVSVVDLDPDREKALNLALNKITGSWDDTRLAELLQELEESDTDTILSGFDEEEIQGLLAGFDPD
ncbi:MAG: ParB N-terminal domain-containing protein, partial [Acutalibacter sp.]|nr:ParB N-terminal domain-containing protein [Acutalibacter sp.]